MYLVENEQKKLLASALDRVSTICVTVGVAAPVAGVFYGLSKIETWQLLAACPAWISAAVGLHLFARHTLGRLRE
jgi:hypothetical protein